MACDYEPEQDENQLTENIFNGGVWEYKSYKHNTYFDPETNQVIVETTDEVLLHQILSFTEHNFILNEPVNFWQNKSSIYTGTYSFYYSEDLSKTKILTLVSDVAWLNGQVYYEYYKESGIPSLGEKPLSKAGDLVFYGKPSDSTLDLPREMNKIN